MPHLTVRFVENKITAENIAEAVGPLMQIIGKHFDEPVNYISAELVPQNKWVWNRKTVDLELDSSPDKEGKRAEVSKILAEELASFTKAFLQKEGIEGDVSAWVRIFERAEYALKF